LATASDTTVRIWDAATGEIVRILTGHFNSVNAVAFSPDGTRLASASFADQDSVRVWDWKPATERAARTLADDGVVVMVKFSPDGTLLASVGFKPGIRIWDTATGRVKFDLLGHSDEIFGLALSRVGTRLAAGGRDRTIPIWDLSTGRVSRTLTGHTD